MKQFIFAYLKYWAKGYLNRTKPQIIGVTGSVGKTSAKEAIFEVLKVKFKDRVRKSYGNLNNETGVPLSILGYKKSPKGIVEWIGVLFSVPFKSLLLKKADILVLEMAADKPGDIKYLTSFAKPNISVLTSIGPSHIKNFNTIDAVIEEKTDLLRALPQNGWAVINLEDENVRKVSYGLRTQALSYAISQDANLKAINISTNIVDYKACTQFEILHNHEKITVNQPTLGKYQNVLASLAATAVGEILQLSKAEIEQGLSKVKQEKHRLNVVKGINNSTIIDDSYNANPLSMQAALELLSSLTANRKIAVIGDMLELGGMSNDAHKLVGVKAKNTADLVISVGEQAKLYQANIAFTNTNDAANHLLKEAKEGDIILIKASRGIGLDKIVDRISLK